MAQEMISTRNTSIQPPDFTGAYFPVRLQGETRGGGTAKQLFSVIFKWKWLIFMLFLAFTIAAGVAMYMKPPVRTATAKILLKPDRVSLQISGSSVGGKLPYPPQVMQSEVELIKSREVLIPVAKNLLVAEGRPEQDLNDGEIGAKIALLRNNTVPVAFPDSSVIQLTYFAETSEEAVRVLRLVLEQYMVQHEVVYTGSTKLLTFYEQEKDRVGAQLRTAEEQLRKWQEANNVTSIDEQISRYITTLADRERGLQQADTELAMGRESVSTRDPLVGKLKGDLVAAEVALQDVLQRYTENDRRVQERREQVALIRKELQAAEKGFLTSLTSQRDTLRGQVREASAAVAAMREKRVEFNRLSRTVDLNRDAFMLYGKKVEEARIAARLDKEQLSNVAVIEAPYAPYITDINKRIGVILLAAIVGVSLGMAIAFVFDFFNNSFRTEEDVEHYLGAPVLASIPDFKDRVLALEGK
ncbi:MAG: GumC family protein [Candidatus Entotheonellia bacterium]